jgi:hypothetical protein
MDEKTWYILELDTNGVYVADDSLFLKSISATTKN